MKLSEYTQEIEKAKRAREAKLAQAREQAENILTEADRRTREKDETLKKEGRKREEKMLAEAEEKAKTRGKKLLEENKKVLEELDKKAAENHLKAVKVVWEAFIEVVSGKR